MPLSRCHGVHDNEVQLEKLARSLLLFSGQVNLSSVGGLFHSIAYQYNTSVEMSIRLSQQGLLLVRTRKIVLIMTVGSSWQAPPARSADCQMLSFRYSSWFYGCSKCYMSKTRALRRELQVWMTMAEKHAVILGWAGVIEILQVALSYEAHCKLLAAGKSVSVKDLLSAVIGLALLAHIKLSLMPPCVCLLQLTAWRWDLRDCSGCKTAWGQDSWQSLKRARQMKATRPGTGFGKLPYDAKATGPGELGKLEAWDVFTARAFQSA